MHAAREKRGRLDHPLDMGVLAAIRLQQEAGGDFRILLGELDSHLPKERELALVVSEELVTHSGLPGWRRSIGIRRLNTS